jgi:hypothetical protein
MDTVINSSETIVSTHKFAQLYNPGDQHRYRLRVLDDTVLRRIFGPKRDEIPGRWRKIHRIMRSITVCTLHEILLG